MVDPEPKATLLKDPVSKSKSEMARWPLSFRIPPGSQHQLQRGIAAFGITPANEKPKKRWWSHMLYRGPNDEQVNVQYSKTKADSEVLAKQFLNEKVVGFDMEWPWNDWKLDRLQNKIGLIQVATEDKVALFHIGLHSGETTDDIIAPSLRKLIESSAIGKVGVSILHADFARLCKYFKLQPKGAVELSHLHRLATFGQRKPELVSTKMASLAHQVEQHLGHPLYKGDVRTSNWSKPLSQEQIKYAAGDAYAGLMLYHCLNYKRLQMDPIPPMPIHAERYQTFALARVGSLYLEPVEEGGKIITSACFFGVPTLMEDLSKHAKAGTASKTSKPKTRTKPTTTPTGTQAGVQIKITRGPGTDGSHVDPTSLALYDELRIWRTAAAAKGGYRIIDAVLLRLAKQRPRTIEALLGVENIGKVTQRTHGKAIIGIITSFMRRNNMEMPESFNNVSPKTEATSRDTVNTIGSSTPDYKSRHRRSVRIEALESSPAFDTPQLHSGLSFTLAETSLAETELTETELAESKLVEPELAEASSSNDSLPSLDFSLSSSSRRTSGQKRKRNDSPSKRAPSSPQKQQDVTSTLQHEGAEIKAPAPQPSRSTTPPPQSTLSPTPLTPRPHIFRNKLTALSRLVATRTKASPLSIVSASTLEALARNPPRTQDELRQIPGAERFAAACADVEMDLLAKIRRFALVER